MRLKETHAALSEGRSIHHRMLVDPRNVRSSILKPVSKNGKLGKGMFIVMKGKWRGKPMFSLTLQERATCPKTCFHWDDCFGNNMAFAHRIKHGKDLTSLLWLELKRLDFLYPSGFVVRLHILGDFYSVAYANFWKRALTSFAGLNIFGYSARDFKKGIGKAVNQLNLDFSSRCWIRQSTNSGEEMTASNQKVENGIVCPEQTGKTQSCLTCGLCWSVKAPIQFLSH